MKWFKREKAITESDVIAYLKKTGWRCRKDEVGDVSCRFDLGDRQVSVIPAVRHTFDGARLSLIKSVATKQFTEALNYIDDGRNSDHEPLIRPDDRRFQSENLPKKTEEEIQADIQQAYERTLQRAREVEQARREGRHKTHDVTESEMVAAVERVLEWARNQDIEQALKWYREHRVDRPGQLQLYHVAALALASEVEKLKDYQRRFAKGDRLNFVPMITDEVIARAVELAERIRRGDPPWG